MTDIQKAYYNELPIGEWVKRDDYQYSEDGHLRWNWQLAFTHFMKHNLIEINFTNGVQYIRRKPTSELV